MSLNLTLSKDRLLLLASGEIPRDALSDARERAAAKLRQMGCEDETLVGRALSVFDEACAAKAESPVVFRDTVLLSGDPPTEPEDARIEWARDFFRTGFKRADSGADQVDYREREEYLSVEQDEWLATFRPAKSGEPGTDALGRPLAPRKPIPLRVRAGENVRYEEETCRYYAAMPGRIRYANGVLAVDNVLHVGESVGLDTGNIHHPGAVTIRGDIEAGSKVEAAGDIDVSGCIEDAEAICGGNLSVHGGILGERAMVRAQGAVRARFMQNAHVRAQGDVWVEREIDNARVRSRGAVTLAHKRGRIAGGAVMALRGVTCEQIGSDASVFTQVVAGEDFEMAERAETLERLLCERRNLRSQAAKGADHGALPAEAGTADSLETLDNRIALLEAEMARASETARMMGVAEIRVGTRVAANVQFKLGRCVWHVREDVAGPLRIFLDAEGICVEGPAFEDKEKRVVGLADAKKASFCLAEAEGREVYLIGTFNEWAPAQLRMVWKEGVYAIGLPLAPGRYEYKFVVDGEWREDPACRHRVPNAFDSFNSVIEIE